MPIWWTYIVECSDKTLYTGISTDVNRRVLEHNTSKKGAKYTKTRRPVKLKYKEEFNNRSDALKRECEIKKLSKKEKITLLNNTP